MARPVLNTDHALPAWLHAIEGGWSLQVHVQPGASRTGSAGMYGEALKLRLAALPIDGRANAALIDYFAARLDVPKRVVVIKQGASGRSKRIEILAPELSLSLLLKRLGDC